MFLVRLRHIEHFEKTLLSEMGRVSGGAFKLETWVAADAFLVLSGAVLTAYVGVIVRDDWQGDGDGDGDASGMA